jgi:hypothetical protein
MCIESCGLVWVRGLVVRFVTVRYFRFEMPTMAMRYSRCYRCFVPVPYTASGGLRELYATVNLIEYRPLWYDMEEVG